jgi:hypothetical protein
MLNCFYKLENGECMCHECKCSVFSLCGFVHEDTLLGLEPL